MDKWTDIANEQICGDCYALINISSYGTCRTYCKSLGIECMNAFEEHLNSCNIQSYHNCDTIFNWTSDALCQCRNGSTGDIILTIWSHMMFTV